MEYVSGLIAYTRPISNSARLNIFKRFWLHVLDHVLPHARNNYYPHALRHRALGLLSVLLISLKLAVLVLLSVSPALTAFSSAITSENIFTLTNQSRIDRNIPALALNQVLSKAAQAKAVALLACNCFQHNLPDGRTPWDFIKAEGYNYVVAGENLAVDFTQAEKVEDAWMNSPGHRANILNPHYQEIGIGIAQGEFQGHISIFVVQMFGTPLEQKVRAANAPTPIGLAQAENKPSLLQAQPNPAPKVAKVKANSTGLSIFSGPADFDILAPQAPQAKPELAITDAQLTILEDEVLITAITQGPAVRVVASFEGPGILLEPKGQNIWQGKIFLSKLVDNNKTVTVQVYDMQGKLAQKVVAGFSKGVVENYATQSPAKTAHISVFGQTLDIGQLEHNFYLIVVTALLTCLVIAILIRRHVQHVSLIANSSFVAILAMFLWMAG